MFADADETLKVGRFSPTIHFPAVSEGFAGVSEGFAACSECLSSCSECFATCSECFAGVSECFAGVSECFAVMTEGLANVTECFAGVTESLAVVTEGPCGLGRRPGRGAREEGACSGFQRARQKTLASRRGRSILRALYLATLASQSH